MKFTRIALSAAIACACIAGSASAQQSRARYQPTAYSNGYYADQTSPSDSKTEAPAGEAAAVAPTASGCSDNPISGCCDSACGSGCDSACGNGCGCGGGCGRDCSGDPWRLFAGDPLGLTIGGWSEIGYHTSNNAGLGLLAPGGAAANFNNYADRVQLQQQWLYAEKIADGSDGVGFGGRIDYLYGTDGPDTQSFGIPNRHWDNSWDNGGAYGHAIPQLYGEVAMGDLSVKVGHFYTIVGQEVVAATGNFFYSRAFTYYNAQPFTHTGFLTTYALDEDTTLWNGYVMGWDSGFEDNGDLYISGFSRQLTDDVKVIYTNTLGRMGENVGTGGERGQCHNLILNNAVTDKLTYLVTFDYMNTHDAAQVGVRNTFGLNNYLIYQVNDCVSLGSRTEWFNYSTGAVAATPRHNADLYNQTVGVNFRLNPNTLVRPEVRWVWDKEKTGANEISPNDGLPLPSQATFGSDLIFTF